MDINQFDPNLNKSKTNQQKSNNVSNVAFDSVLAAKLGEKVSSTIVNPNEKIQKQYLDKKRRVNGIESAQYVEEDEESVPVIVNNLKKTMKKLIELEQRFLGL